MSIISGYQKIKKHIKTADGYQLLSHWTSSDTVEMNDGTTLEHRISNVDNTPDQDKPVSIPQQNALNQKADTDSPALMGTPTAPTPSSGTNTNQIATTAFVQTAVSNGIAASDAMIIKGTIGTTGTVTALPSTYQTGWTYRVVTDGIYAGQSCEIGDLIIALVDRDDSDQQNSDWCIAQTNINGAITGVKSEDASIHCSQSGSVASITHNDASRSNTSSTAKPSAGGTFTAVKSITSDTKGHVTGVETETVTLPALDAKGLGVVSTAASQGLSDTEKANARNNIGAGTSSFSGSYNDLSNKPTSLPANGGSADHLNPILIPASSNLNAAAYQTPGFYYCPANATVTTLSNCPTKNAFFMLVGKHAGTYQEIIEYVTNNPKRWMRNCYNNTWSSWYHIYTEANKPTASEIGALAVNGTLPISNGGTGKTTLTANQVLVGNGTNPISQRAIDTTSGGTANSTSLITSGAVNTGLSTKVSKNDFMFFSQQKSCTNSGGSTTESITINSGYRAIYVEAHMLNGTVNNSNSWDCFVKSFSQSGTTVNITLSGSYFGAISISALRVKA